MKGRELSEFKIEIVITFAMLSIGIVIDYVVPIIYPNINIYKKDLITTVLYTGSLVQLILLLNNYRIKTDLIKITNLIKEIKKKPKVYFLKDRKDMYRLFYRQIEKLSRGSRIFIFSAEKPETPYITGPGSPYEDLLMDLWIKRVKNRDFEVKQIVHVSTEKDFNELIDRLNKFKDIREYQLSAYIEPEYFLFPFMELLIAIDDKNKYYFAHLDFSDDPQRPFVDTFTIVIMDRDIVVKLAQYFMNILWNNSIIIKNEGGIIDSNLAHIHEKLKFMKLINYKEILSYSSKSTSIISSLSNKNIVEMLVNTIESLHKEYMDSIKSLEVGELHLFNREKSIEKLIEIYSIANKSIIATSYVENVAFWKSKYGETILELNKRLVNKGVKITRIFIFNSLEEMKTISYIIDEMRNAGIDVKCIVEPLSRGLTQDYLRDFAIVDDQIVFEEVFDWNKKIIKGSKIYYSPIYVKKFKDIVKKLYVIGTNC